MAIHNWIRCHWRNGRHVLHDVPEAWDAEIEAHLRQHRARARDLGTVRTATLDSLELAWVECEVPLGSPASDLTYRRARAVHALVRARGAAPAWTREEASSLLARRYGDTVDRGLAAQHRVLARLSYPHDAGSAAGLFVGAEAPLPSELEPEAGSHGLGYARRHLVDAWEEWVAAGSDARGERGVARPTPAGVWCTPAPSTPPTDPADALRGLAAAGARRGVAGTASAPRPPDVACEEPDGTRADPLAETRPWPRTDAPPAASSAPELRTETDDREEEPRLFDLSRPRCVRPTAPSGSLAGLLGPSHTSSSAP